MPPFNLHHRWGIVLIVTLAGLGITVPDELVAGESVAPICIRSRQVELDYRATGSPNVEVELWYTRDRGTSWQCAGRDEDRTSPFVFTAPGEGLYGLLTIAYVDGKPSRPAPNSYESPQKWVFIDATPPLAQWDGVEPADGFATNHRLQLRWTVYDANLMPQPIKLLYQSSIDQKWRTIEDQTNNTGIYEWKVPETVGGQVTLKLLASDQGGHIVERPFGPISLEKMIAVAGPAKDTHASGGAETRPAIAEKSIPDKGPGFLSDKELSTTQPDISVLPRVDLLKQRMAADLYRQGSWHLVRGQYGVAAERLREAIEQNPDLLEAHQDLAGIFYRQQDYDRAITEYQAILSRNNNHEAALYGAALAHVAKRDYPQSREMLTRLLTINDRNAEAWLDLGDVLFMMGDTINARANWRRAAKVDLSAKEVVSKAQRRLEQYGTDEIAKK